ncbi:hypothetical protein [Glycomyces sp. NRRL B-16210]|uniref:hypothetical protein n=1 Tax=Glycomyces sp. NRRL B-16210 TaxID=1463821 RepID=UPI0004C268F6|nr:hypothetical protein [Glycomyces sp. NRRL B-16210]
MSRDGVAAQLLRIGRAAGTRAEAGGIRFTALLLAALLLPLGLAAPVLLAAAIDGRHDRAALQTPTIATADTPDEEILLVSGELDRLPNSRQFQVDYISPLGPGAPLPPGLPAWPAPGEVYLSPRLAEIGGEAGVDERYGEVVGAIDADALLDPNQLYAYVRPLEPLSRTQTDDLGLLEVTEFGSSGDWRESANWLLLQQDYAPISFFYLFTFLLLTVPACLLAFAATRVAAHARDRREALIRVLGGRPRHTVLVSFGETWLPVVIGTIGAGVALATVMLADLSLPYVEFTSRATDARAIWPLLAGGLAASVAALFSMSLLVPTARLHGREPTRGLLRPRPRLFATLAWMFPACFVLAAWGPSFFPQQSAFYFLLNYLGQAGVVITVAPAIALVCAWLGNLAKDARWARQRPSVLAAAARVAAYPKATARQLTAIIIAFFLLFFAFAYHSAWTVWVVEDRAITGELAGSFAEGVPAGALRESEVGVFLEELPSDLVVLAWAEEWAPDMTKTITVSGSCEALALLRLECPDGSRYRLDGTVPDDRFAAWLDARGSGMPTSVVVEDASAAEFVDARAGERDARGRFLLIAPDGLRVPEAEIKAAGTVFQLGLSLEVLGGDEVGSTPSEEQARWITAFGTVALAVLALTSVLSASGEFLRHGRALAPIGVLTGGLRTFRATSAITVFLPLLIGTTVGVTVGIAASNTLMRPGTTLLKAEYLVPTVCTLLVVSVLMWLWASTVAIREAVKWRPGQGG